MADNVAITAGSGTTIAADDVGGVLHQRVKISQGADGSATDVSSAAPLQVTLANTGANATAVKVDGSAVTQPVSIATAPVLVAGSAIIGKVGIDQTTVGTTNAISLAQIGATTVATGNGVVSAGVQRISVASDNTPFAVKTDQTTHGTTDLVAADITKVAGTAIVNGGVAGSQSVGGTVATNVAITANPINLGAQAVSSENTAVTTARQVQLVADLVGKLIVLPYANPENFVSGAITTAMTGTTSTSLVSAPGASLRNYITTIIVSNSHATVGTDIIIQDGSGGTTLMTIPAAAVYGGAVINLPVPLRQPTTNTAIYCANVTTGASTKVSAVGYKGA